ncbi:MAG: hypothetical protein COB16_01220 [Rhodobacteraceae bacterium]|nr:MAG: hypothetical protein COB16_01220 [Paracoccaceae bacterium]
MIARLVNFFGEKRHSRRRWKLFLKLLVLIVIADFLVPRPHVDYFWQAIPGWAAIFGFISCAAIIFISKFIGHSGGIMRDEDYYD